MSSHSLSDHHINIPLIWHHTAAGGSYCTWLKRATTNKQTSCAHKTAAARSSPRTSHMQATTGSLRMAMGTQGHMATRPNHPADQPMVQHTWHQTNNTLQTLSFPAHTRSLVQTCTAADMGRQGRGAQNHRRPLPFPAFCTNVNPSSSTIGPSGSLGCCCCMPEGPAMSSSMSSSPSSELLSSLPESSPMIVPSRSTTCLLLLAAPDAAAAAAAAACSWWTVLKLPCMHSWYRLTSALESSPGLLSSASTLKSCNNASSSSSSKSSA
mmetsp:Transcript_23623/g.60356  ORF Transcript_23623/g.60356 Transcript_23623/m.60356 type:complete len:267 (+) Transcript_23623:140-940(+)